VIELRREGSIHIATMNNGPNMVDPAWQKRMLEVLDAVEGDCEGEAGLVLTGEGKAFSTGLNVEVVMSLQGADQKAFGENMLKVIGRLLCLPVPTVAAINGHAFAAGAFLALACDYRIMREDRGWFCISEVDVGVPIGMPMMNLLKSKTTPQTARDSVLSGQRYVAEEAMALGLADAKASEGDLLAAAIEKANSLAAKERRIFGTLKRQLYADAAAGFGFEL